MPEDIVQESGSTDPTVTSGSTGEIRPPVPTLEEEASTESINPSCTNCGDFRGGALGHTAEQCKWEGGGAAEDPETRQRPAQAPSEGTVGDTAEVTYEAPQQ